MDDQEQDSTGLKTVERALAVLEMVAVAQRAPSVKGVASAIGHNISSTYNIVNTLIRAGYLSKDSSGAVHLGNRISLLASGLERNDDYAQLLKPYAEHVNTVSGETVYLTRRVGDRVVIQRVFEGTQSLRVTGLEVGFFGSEDRRASGKAILAFLDQQAVLSVLQTIHQQEGADAIQQRYDLLLPELDDIRARGFAFDDEAFEPGVCCIAAPYFDSTGSVAGSLAASGPAVRVAALKGATKEALMLASYKMSAALGAFSHIA